MPGAVLSHVCLSFVGWGPFLRVAIPGALMICAEWWAWEVATFLSGLVSVTVLAAQTTLSNIMLFMIPLFFAWGRSGFVILGIALGNEFINQLINEGWLRDPWPRTRQ